MGEFGDRIANSQMKCCGKMMRKGENRFGIIQKAGYMIFNIDKMRSSEKGRKRYFSSPDVPF